MKHVLIYYVAHCHLNKKVSSEFGNIFCCTLLNIFDLCWDFEEILLVNNKVPVIGEHMAKLLRNFNLVPGKKIHISFSDIGQ